MSGSPHWATVRPDGVPVSDWIQRSIRENGEVAVMLRDLLAELPPATTILDLGSGPGSFDYRTVPETRILATDILPLQKNPETPHVVWFRADAAKLPLRDDSADVVISHYVFEHVDDLRGTLDEMTRVLKRGGTVFCSLPRTSSFDDRFYRFAGYVAKYGLGKFKKRIEHVQRFSFESLNREFYRRGYRLDGFSVVPAGYSWLNDPRTRPMQGLFVSTLGWIKRLFGFDLFKDANFVCRFRLDGTPAYRPVTNVCRQCGEHAILRPPSPPPSSWTCPWCGLENGLFLTPGERRQLEREARAAPDREPR